MITTKHKAGLAIFGLLLFLMGCLMGFLALDSLIDILFDPYRYSRNYMFESYRWSEDSRHLAFEYRESTVGSLYYDYAVYELDLESGQLTLLGKALPQSNGILAETPQFSAPLAEGSVYGHDRQLESPDGNWIAESECLSTPLMSDLMWNYQPCDKFDFFVRDAQNRRIEIKLTQADFRLNDLPIVTSSLDRSWTQEQVEQVLRLSLLVCCISSLMTVPWFLQIRSCWTRSLAVLIVILSGGGMLLLLRLAIAVAIG